MLWKTPDTLGKMQFEILKDSRQTKPSPNLQPCWDTFLLHA